jgi:acetyltransferase
MQSRAERVEAERVTNLPHLFSFETIAIVGASDDSTRIGGAPIFLLKKYGFEGKIVGINPRYTSVQGVPCYPDAGDVPGNIDAAIMCVAASRLREIFPKLLAKGLKAAAIFSAGFSESGEEGRKLQDWLTAFARDNNVAIVGPNCIGQVSFTKKRALTFANAFLTLPVFPTGQVALLSQSGGIATNIWADAVLSGTRFSHVITTGNEADLGLTDYLKFLADDPDTNVVLGYVEGLRDGAKFCVAAERMRQAGKPLIMIKVGASAAAQDVVSSHTGQLSSDDSGYQAAFDKHDIIRVHSLQELNDYARLFSFRNLGRKVTVATTSGGASVYVTDLCDSFGIEMGVLSAATEKELAKVVPSYGRVRNPVDLTAQTVNDISMLDTVMTTLMRDPETDILLFLLSGKGTPEQSAEVISVLTKVQAEAKKTLIVCWLGVSEEVRRRGTDAGLHVYQDPKQFLQPLRDYHRFYDAVAAGRASPTAQAGFKTPQIDIAGLRKELMPSDAGRLVLGERQSMKLLADFGVDCPKIYSARSAADIAQIATDIAWPCVMKLAQPVIAHKSDVQGVVLNIASPQELMAAWDQMVERLEATEVIVVEQVERGQEIIVGCLRDATFGMRLTVGSGGVWTNMVRDTITLIPPFTEDYIRSVLPRLAMWEALNGARGQPPLAVDALVHAIGRIAALGWSLRDELREFECNPVIVNQTRAVAVDAVGFA